VRVETEAAERWRGAALAQRGVAPGRARRSAGGAREFSCVGLALFDRIFLKIFE
jgi:hypothetical protein